jgi:hypothetical protein
MAAATGTCKASTSKQLFTQYLPEYEVVCQRCSLVGWCSYAADAVYLQVQAGACSSSVAPTIVKVCTSDNAAACAVCCDSTCAQLAMPACRTLAMTRCM